MTGCRGVLIYDYERLIPKMSMITVKEDPVLRIPLPKTSENAL